MRRHPLRARWLIAVIVLITASTGVFVAVAKPGITSTPGAASRPVTAVHVAGNRLVNQLGQPLQLLGASRSGGDYACIEGKGIFEGDIGTSTVLAMKRWGMSAVRVPLNEDCWLGINGVQPQWSGIRYQQAIAAYVKRLTARGMAVILDLHWTAPGSTPATKQEEMPDQDHAPAFWRSVATAYANQPAVLFDLFNEPSLVSWSCWLNGCTTSDGWQAAGMQTLVDAVRGTGADNVILASGLRYANDLTGWEANEPHDPKGQLAASFHVYNFNACITEACWDATIAPVAAKVPVIAAEVGENDCRSAFADSFFDWADSHAISTLAWTWNAWDCSDGPALITSYDGAPTPYGNGVRLHFVARRTELQRSGVIRTWHW